MMHPLQEIRHTTPLGSWSLVRAQPGADLAADVVEFWEVQGRLSPFREAVLPNGCVEIMLNLGPPHRVFEGPGSGTWEQSWYSGLQERSIFIESLEGTHLVSVRLHSLGAARLLGVGAASAANSIVRLESLIGSDAERLRSNVLSAGTPAARFVLLERFLHERLAAAPAIPAFVAAAARRIEATHGRLRVGTLPLELDVSRKHLAVSFRRYLGISAKAYAGIRRFIWTLESLRRASRVEWSQLAAEAGYSDQSHLARDFRRVGAASPTEYLRHIAPDGDALLEAVG
jgi:AraC-like DNA-binding protein